MSKEFTSFSFILPTRIEFGAGAIEKLPEELSRLGAEKVMLVTDKGIASTDILRCITTLLDGAGKKYDLFDGVEPNPRDENVHAGAEKARGWGSDCLVAVGGGSSIDCAKGISVVAVNGGRVQDYRGVEKVAGKTIPMVAIPTTAGSGSEVTFSSVITDTAEKTKFSFRSTKAAAKVAICDPRLTVSMPAPLTAATGMDALTHAIEGYTARCTEPIAEAVALHAIEYISQYLERAVINGTDLEARSGMLLGSLMAAISFSHADVASVHCIAESLGGMYDLPHGVCNAMCLPVVMDHSKNYCVEKYARVGTAMGLNFSNAKEGAEAAVAEVRRLASAVGIPRFSSFNIPKSEYRSIAAKSVENLSNASNPKIFDEKDYMQVLKRLAAEK